MTVLKEMERMRAEIHKPQEATPSILQPKILNFDNTGSSGNRREIGSSTLASAPAWDAAPKEQAHVIQNHDDTFVTPSNKDLGNFMNNNTLLLTLWIFNVGMSLIMAKEL